MKLILREYLASLKERDELDAMLPGLLSQMGLNVYSVPGKGTRQDGVDVAAYGSINEGPEKVYLFSIKEGNLTRTTWNGASVQALRPSIDEIFDAYIPNRLPSEYRDKPIVICLCFGGVVQEQVRPDLKGYIDRHTTDNLTFEEWNGDKLAELIQTSFLREELFYDQQRTLLRKCLSLLEEPEVSFKYFRELITFLVGSEHKKDKDYLTTIRQLNICLWIIYSWCREAGNIEAAYLSSESALLNSWELSKKFVGKSKKIDKDVLAAFQSIQYLYLQITSDYVENKILPYTDKRHALSVAAHPLSNIDLNLKMFDVLGRVALRGLWIHWLFQRVDKDEELAMGLSQQLDRHIVGLKQFILNNPILFTPYKDEQAIDIAMVGILLLLDKRHHSDLRLWLSEIVNRTRFAYEVKGTYPCNINEYYRLIEHPVDDTKEYMEEVTAGSILYPVIAILSGLLGFNEICKEIADIKLEILPHCNFQLWYPDETTELNFYTNSELHGATLSHINVEDEPGVMLQQVFHECDASPYGSELSVMKYGQWPMVLVGCRHYRLPIPIHMLHDIYKNINSAEPDKVNQSDTTTNEN